MRRGIGQSEASADMENGGDSQTTKQGKLQELKKKKYRIYTVLQSLQNEYSFSDTLIFSPLISVISRAIRL